MQGAPIDALNEGLRTFKNDLAEDALASQRVEIAIVTFDSSVKVIQDFVTVDRFDPPTLHTTGLTHMGGGINTALDLLQSRKATYKTNKVMYYRPWVFLITDGAPQGETNDVVQRASQRVKEEETSKRVAFFAVGVEGADMARLSQIVEREPIKLDGLNFRDMFLWLSASMQQISKSKPGDQVALPPPGWGSI